MLLNSMLHGIAMQSRYSIAATLQNCYCTGAGTAVIDNTILLQYNTGTSAGIGSMSTRVYTCTGIPVPVAFTYTCATGIENTYLLASTCVHT